MRQINVFWDGVVAGRLWLEPSGRFGFRYTQEWLGGSRGRSLSCSLPLRDEPYLDDAARPFFAGLLPEGEVRSALARRFGISAQNDFELLARIGRECAGALSLIPEGELPAEEGGYDPLPDAELDGMLQRASIRPLVIRAGDLRLSLAGAQDKLPLYHDGTGYFLTKGNAPSTHILKPPIPNFPDTVANELFCLRLAGAVGLPAPDAFHRSGNVPALVVARYDRMIGKDGRHRRLHQEDLCQALGRMPDQKYEGEGGPTLPECFDLVARASAQPLLDRKLLLQMAAFSLFIGNADAHGKNLSLLHGDDGIRLAPCYDLLSTIVYPALSGNAAMKIGGEKRMTHVFPRHWLRLADAIGIKPRTVQGIVRGVAETVRGTSPNVAVEVAGQCGGGQTLEKVLATIEQQTSRALLPWQ